MGAFGKVLKGIGTVASIVAAPATGGASLGAGAALQGIGAAAETVGKVADTAGKVGSAASSVLGGGSAPAAPAESMGQSGLLNSLNSMAPGQPNPRESSAALLNQFQNMQANAGPVDLPVTMSKQEGTTSASGTRQDELFKLLQQLRG